MARTIAIIVFPGFQLLDAAGPIAAFELAGRESARPPYRIRVLAGAAGPVASSSGIMLTAEALPAPSGIDTLLVVGGRGTREADADPALLAWLRDTAPAVRRVASVCTGAFVLAAAGLLDGRRVTTHWRHAATLARQYPTIDVEPDRIFVRDGNIWTSAGITAGIDLALALIAEDLGEALAKRTAQWLVVYHRRPGGQSQFSALLRLDSPGGRFGRGAAGRAAGSSGGDEPAQFRARFRRRDRHDAGQGDRASPPRSRPRPCRGGQWADRPGGVSNRLRRPGADASRVHPRLWSAAAGIAPRGPGLRSSQARRPRRTQWRCPTRAVRNGTTVPVAVRLAAARKARSTVAPSSFIRNGLCSSVASSASPSKPVTSA
jgi:putative intracellular protease/amidase